MKKIIFLFLFVSIGFCQQINYTWGQKTDGSWWNQTGSVNTDSTDEITIIFDFQDYWYLDFVKADWDSVTSIANSNRQYIGTFWYQFDAENATDSVVYVIKTYSGMWKYDDGDENRIESGEYLFSTTATTVVDTQRAKGDIQAEFVNLYVDASTDDNGVVTKHLPPELLKVVMDFGTNSNDSLDVYWNFAYPAIYESQQSMRNRRTGDTDRRKPMETLH